MEKKRDAIEFTFFEEFFPKKPSKSDRRRLQIVEQAITELATSGLDATTHDSLALACGVSRALVRHYFPDRDDLILITMQYIRARFQKLCIDEILKHDRPREQLRAYIETVCTWKKFFPKDAKVWLLFYYYCGINAKYRKLNSELVKQGQERIAALLEKGVRAREFKAGKYQVRAKIIQNTITGYFISSISENHDEKFQNEMISDTLDECLSIADGDSR